MAEPAKDVYRSDHQNETAPRAILILTADKTEDLEFFYPYYRFLEAGFRVDVATPEGGEFKGKQGLGLKQTKKIKDMKADDYVLLYIPGGKAPAELKNNLDAINLVRKFCIGKKPVAAICHGPQLLAAAHVIDGRKLTAWPEVKDEVVVASGIYVDQETVTDGPFTTARWPGDLPAHLKQVLKELERTGRSSGEKIYAAA